MPSFTAPVPGREREAAEVERLCRGIVDQEIDRLRRRTPALVDRDLHTVESALHQIIDRLLLTRVRARPSAVRHLSALFGLAASLPAITSPRGDRHD